MCTVSFIPVKNSIYITSNRDEKLVRKKALPPKKYPAGNMNMVFPRDGEAGGSWIGMCSNGNAAVLLNGAFHKHVPTPPYAKSRGLIFLEILSGQMPVNHFLNITLTKIEPFTLVVFQNFNLYECRWDGFDKHCNELSKSNVYIWSSATLYDESVIKKRESWFCRWLTMNPGPSWEDIFNFHQFGGEGDTQNDFRMNRDNQLLTVSITGIEINNECASMRHLDFGDNNIHETRLDFFTACPV